MPLNELTDEQLDNRLRDLLPPAPRSRSWERTQRERLVRYITTGEPELPHRQPAAIEPNGPRDLRELVAPVVSRRPTSRLVAMAAAAVLVVAGITALAVMQRDATTSDVSPGFATSPPSAPANVTVQPTAVTNPPATNVGTPEPGTGSTTDTEPPAFVAVLEPALGVGPATTAGRVDRWINHQQSAQHAIRTNADGTIDAVSWHVAPASEWTKTFHDQPDVTLPDGTTAKRLVPTAVDVVVYAVPTDDGVFTANLPPTLEDQLAAWFADAATTPIGDVAAPDGFNAMASESDQRTVNYSTGVSTTVMTFDAPIDLNEYLAATSSGATVEPLQAPDTVLVTRPGNPGASDSYVVWQPRPDLIVQLTGPTERLASLAPHITLAALPAPDITERNPMAQDIDPDTADIVLLGETAQGRFAYLHDTTTDGRSCTAFSHSAYGGGGSCTDETAPAPPPACGSGWNAPDLFVADAFVIGITPPTFEFTIDGATVQPNIETGITDGTPWTYATISEPGHPQDQTVTITLDEELC